MSGLTPTCCPACTAFELRVIESRRKARYTRRRKECGGCGHRLTTYELSAEYFEEVRDAKLQLNKIYKVLGSAEVSTPSKEGVTCYMCIHMTGRGCQLDFPEAGGAFAAECSSYQEFV